VETLLRSIYCHGFVAAIVGGLWVYAAGLGHARNAEEPMRLPAMEAIVARQTAPQAEREIVPIGMVDLADAIEP
jgi:hypothetical protein